MTDPRPVPLPTHDTDHLQRYVLGVLDEPACELIEHDAFGNPDVALSIDAAETLLIDGYVAGTLAPTQKALVERALAVRPRLRERLQVARALASSRGTRVSARGWWLALATAAAVLVATALWSARSVTPHDESVSQAQLDPGQRAVVPDQASPTPPVTSSPSGTSLPGAHATPPAEATEAPRPLRSVFAVTLPAGVSRRSEARTMLVPSSATHVELVVPIAAGDDFPRYQLRVRDARGREIGMATAAAPRSSRTISVVIARGVLVDGAYEVTVEGLSAQGLAEPLAYLDVRVAAQP